MTSNVQQESAGVFAVAAELAKFGWFPRILPPPDHGVDAHVELADPDGRPDGRILGIQIKSGPSHFKRARPGGWLLGLKKGNLAYWARYRLPVVVCLYDTEAEVAYWQAVKAEHLLRAESGAYSLFIPDTQRLEAGAIATLEELASVDVRRTSDLEQALRERRAEFDLSWIERLASGDRIFVEAEEWVNKTSGRGSLRLIVEEKDGFSEIEREWPYVFMAGASYADELPQLFPWATLGIDEAFYAHHDRDAYIAAVGVWDKETERYFFPVDFDEWAAENLPRGIRPYAESPEGEVAYWRLELVLNELGHDTLEKARDEEMGAYFAELEEDWMATLEADAAVPPYYEGQYGDGPAGTLLERVAFTSGDEFMILLADAVLWSDDKKRREVGDAILSHATGHDPSRALVQAFVNRFATLLDDEEGNGWTLGQDEVTDWLSELRVAF